MTEKLTDEALEDLAEGLNNDMPLFPHEKRAAAVAIRELLALRRATPADDLRAAAHDVLAERARQLSAEGWTPEHDGAYADGELAKAAGCYAWMAGQNDTLRSAFGAPPPTWPWDPAWWKPTDCRRDLVKAGALILAEIERLDRAALAQKGDA